MAESLRAGKTLPPILVEKKTFRVVDGFHRVEAHRRVYGEGAHIQALMKAWPDEQSMMVEMVECNVGHGRSLTTQDKARCIALLEGTGLVPEQIASALHMTPEKVGEMKLERLAQYKMEPIALKRSTSHFAGTDLSEATHDYNNIAGGHNQSFYVNQVIAMLESESVDWANERLITALKKLHAILETTIMVKT
jgi:hypothetical protein